jgi:hypothetical protein
VLEDQQAQNHLRRGALPATAQNWVVLSRPLNKYTGSLMPLGMDGYIK